jgi:hypothetical protein
MCSNVFNFDFEIGLKKLTDCPTEKALLTKFLHFFSPSLAADNKESCTSLLARIPLDKHPAVSMVFGAIRALKKTS